MTLDPNYSVGVGFFAFRAIATVALFEPDAGTLEDGRIIESTHYLRTYGVTAEWSAPLKRYHPDRANPAISNLG